MEPASGVGFNVFHDMFGTPDDRVWDNQLTDEATWRAHNPPTPSVLNRGMTDYAPMDGLV